MTTQKEKILNILSDNYWHCTSEMYASYIADPRTRLCELAKSGIELEWRWCSVHEHRKSKEWRLKRKEGVFIVQPPSVFVPVMVKQNEEFLKQLKLLLTPTFNHE